MTPIQYALSMRENGYCPIPLSRKNTKKGISDQPLVKLLKDNKKDPLIPSVEDVRNWQTRFVNCPAVALHCGAMNNVISLDFDIVDSVVNQAMRRVLDEAFPSVLLREGNHPKFAILFRADPKTMRSVSTGQSFTYLLEGKESVIELMGYSAKPITAFGSHRTSHVAYSWRNNLSPANVPATKLPVLSLDDIHKLFRTFYAAMTHYHPEIQHSRLAGHKEFIKHSSRFSSNVDIKSSKSSDLQISDSQVVKILERCEGKTREGWMQAGRALHDHYQGGRIGLLEWVLWSQQWEDVFEEGACESEWDRFVIASARGVGTTMQTLKISVDKAERAEGSELMDKFLDRYVMVQDGAMVGDRKSDSGDKLIKLGDFKAFHANKLIPVPLKDGSTKMVAVVPKWQCHPQRRGVFGQTFNPSGGRICTHLRLKGSTEYWNTYVPPEWTHPKKPKPELLQVFLDHCHYLFDDEELGFEWMMNWLAQMIQDPANRGTVTPLHVSTYTGTGRGWYAELIRELVGVLNSKDTTISRMSGDGNFRGYLENSVFCSIGETREENNRFGVSEQLKRQLSDPYLVLNVKYKGDELSFIMTRFFFMTNHIDGMVIDSNERRIAVFANHKPPKDSAYYGRLYSMSLNEEFKHNVWSYLMNYTVDKSMLVNQPQTRTRDQMINATFSPLAKAYTTLKGLVDNYDPLTLESFIERFHAIHSPDSFFTTNEKELAMLEREYVVETTTCFLTQGNSRVTVSVRGFKPVDVTTYDLTREENLKRIESYFSQWK